MKHSFILIGTLFLANTALAETQLDVDEHIKVTAINGQEIKHGALQPLKRHFNLQAGKHVITARYDRLFDLTRGDHDYLKSNNITVTVNLEDNQSYQLVMPNQPSHYTAAKEYAKAPSLAVMHNGQIIAEETTTAENSSIFANIGTTLGSMFQRGDSAVVANQKAIAALNTQPQDATTTPKTEQVDRQTLDGFMQIWLDASEEEREKIRQWIQK